MRKKQIHIVQNAFLPDLLKEIESQGESLDFIRDDALLRKFDLSDADKYIPATVQDRIMLALNHRVGAKSLVAEMNHNFRSTNMGSISNYIFQAPTFLNLLEAVVKYQKNLRSDYLARISSTGPVTVFSVKINCDSIESLSILEEVDIARMIDVFRLVDGDDFSPIELGITSDTSQYLEPILPNGNYNILTGQDESWIKFRTSVLIKKPPRLFKGTVDLPKVGVVSTSDKIERLLQGFYPGHFLNMKEIGPLMDVSRRTIERELKKEGTTFFEIKQRFLRRKSIELIMDPALSVKEIASQLNFSNSQNFIRNFRSWSGMTPMQYRNTL